ncbi:hypothetical protein RB653_009976 [Dictyostelium firmibasis]|uniref:Uncharacterized protein n=1 Tax=Dictyostelium firmibasis TaxID=79012 RepID=A0AAN7TT17_9MYCE
MSLFLNIIKSNIIRKEIKSNQINIEVNNVGSFSLNSNTKWAPIILYRYYCIAPCYV